MNLSDAIAYASSLKRFECVDLTFDDAEIFIEDSSGTEIGSGYTNSSSASMYLTINNIEYTFQDEEARALREAIPLAMQTRNDNGGEW